MKALVIAAFLALYFFSPHGCSAENNITFAVSSVNKVVKKNSQFLLLPVPKQYIALKSSFSLNAKNKAIKANYRVLNTWPTISGERFIRLLAIELGVGETITQPLTLNWRASTKAPHIQNLNPLESINSQLVYPSMAWLLQSVLLHPNKIVNSDWYTEPQKKYAHYVTDQNLLTDKGYPPYKASQWLYDRPQALYQLFLMSEETLWLHKANELADFYIQNIDENGLFKLKKSFDPKLLMPKGVLYRYLLSGNFSAKKTLKRMFERSLDWDESYTLRRGFWTERNQAAALNVAVAYWELSNDEKALKRVNDIIDATVAMTFYPENDWLLVGCPQHSFHAHEGWGDKSPACSPWMMALLGDALWRFYQLTGDTRAASLIDTFGDFILNYGIYYGNARVKSIVIPKYIVSITNPSQEELNQWTDPQHACDVAALLGKSAYIKQKNRQDNFLVKTLFGALLEQCAKSYAKLKKAQQSKRDTKYWLLKPPRRFGWMYSTTSDLPWLNKVLLNDFLN
ncbi:MAG: hypothetical protein ACPG52_05150 [Cognaticolwellia sp.]